MEKRIIFHIPFKIDEKRLSGTNIRPAKLLESFKQLGYTVDFISGYGNERKKSIEKIKENIKNGIKYEFLYSESSTMPTLLTEKNHFPKYPFLDFNFFKFCKKHGIKIGLFYRDIHWNYPHYRVSYLKKIIARIFYKYDLKKYNEYLDILFLPCKKMANYIPVSLKMRLEECYPGSDNNILEYKKNNQINMLFVGGSGGTYDYSCLMNVLSIEKFKKNISFTIITRKDEYEKFIKEKSITLNSNIKVLYGNIRNLDIKNIDIGIFYLKPQEYLTFAVPLKLFEYIADGLPILAPKNTFVGDFVEKNNIGWQLEYDEKVLEEFLDKIIENRDLIIAKRKEVLKIRENHTWLKRAEEIAEKMK